MFGPTNSIRYFLSYNGRKIIRHFNDKLEDNFAAEKTDEILGHQIFQHSLPLYRQLQGVDQNLFENKITNLNLALRALNGIIIEPGETWSLWNLVGPPSKERGFLPGLIISKGQAAVGTGGGLCQLANLIYWLSLHSELDITEKHRHSFDIFPDSDRKVPFGTGATIVYNYKDLRIHNGTERTYQFAVSTTQTDLKGVLHCNKPEKFNFRIIEKNPSFSRQRDGIYRSNQIFRQKTDPSVNSTVEELISENYCRCQYTPEGL